MSGIRSWSWSAIRWWAFFLPSSSSQWWVHFCSFTCSLVWFWCYYVVNTLNFPPSLFTAGAVGAVWAACGRSFLLSGHDLLQKWWHCSVRSRHLAHVCSDRSGNTLLRHLEAPLCSATQSGPDLQMTTALTSQGVAPVFEQLQGDELCSNSGTVSGRKWLGEYAGPPQIIASNNKQN